MHPSALKLGELFFKVYCEDSSGITILDVGAQDVNGSLRDVRPPGSNYIGVDFCEGKGVDVLLDDPYVLPFDSNSIDVIVCSSVLEHSQFFWVMVLEMVRVLKPSGLLYLNVPSNGYVHRYPVDCWRFYPDSGKALVDWGKRNGYILSLLESFIGAKECVSVESDAWNDFVAVILKGDITGFNKNKRIIKKIDDYSNGYCDDQNVCLNPSLFTDDFKLIDEKDRELAMVKIELAEQLSEVAVRDSQLLELECELAARDSQLSERDRELAEREGELSERDRNIAAQNSRLAESENEVKLLSSAFKNHVNFTRKMVKKRDFDPAWYLMQNPDAKVAGSDPWEHYAFFGAPMGRLPVPDKFIHRNLKRLRLIVRVWRYTARSLGGVYPALKVVLASLRNGGFAGVRRFLITQDTLREKSDKVEGASPET